jgi:uncharacterized protein YuzE
MRVPGGSPNQQSARGETMRVTYDRAVDAAYIYLMDAIVPGTARHTYPCDPLEVNGQINLDFDAAGRLIGIEVLDASRLLPERLLEQATGK